MSWEGNSRGLGTVFYSRRTQSGEEAAGKHPPVWGVIDAVEVA